MTIIENLLNETLNALTSHGKTPADVAYISDGKHVATWEQFAEMAKAVEYNADYGGHEINLDLRVIGKDETWWLARGEYDGSEWWEYVEVWHIKPDESPLLTDAMLFAYWQD